MSSIELLFPSVSITDTEVQLVSMQLSHPSVLKYLRILAQGDANELLTYPIHSASSSEVLNAHATIRGRLEVLSTLLAIGENHKGVSQ